LAHIEMGESAPAALAREIQEELGQARQVGSFLGAIENSWLAGDKSPWWGSSME
jgi:8-oxo-dGTP pyrophosphatase MutT (NUDIX family)